MSLGAYAAAQKSCSCVARARSKRVAASRMHIQLAKGRILAGLQAMVIGLSASQSWLQTLRCERFALGSAIVSFPVGPKHVVVINTLEMAKRLFKGRSAIYSERLDFVLSPNALLMIIVFADRTCQ